MKTVVFIPIKSRSERVPDKNFRKLAGKPLFQHIVDNCRKAACFDEIVIDTDSDLVRRYADDNALTWIEREDWLASDQANGNDLLVAHAEQRPEFALYFQCFATAPFLRPESIARCVRILQSSSEHDSIFTATEEKGWFWFGPQPVNFRPGILPRSQDARCVVKESTGLYGITRESLLRYHCRTGANPYVHLVTPAEAMDLDTEADFEYADWITQPG